MVLNLLANDPYIERLTYVRHHFRHHYTTAEGTDAVDNMNDLVDTLGNLGSSDQFTKLVHQGIKEAKRYLKTEFTGHVGREKIVQIIVQPMH